MNTPEFKRLMQIGIIVRNVEEAVANNEAIGIGPWEISVMDNSVPPFDDLKIDGGFLAISLAARSERRNTSYRNILESRSISH